MSSETVNQVADGLRKYSDADLTKMTRRSSILLRIASATFLVCVVAGIWFDWKWLATAILPLFVTVVMGVRRAAEDQEICRRNSERRGTES